VFFHLLFVANDFALREQGVSRVNDAGAAADEAALVAKRNNARKSTDIRSPATKCVSANRLIIGAGIPRRFVQVPASLGCVERKSLQFHKAWQPCGLPDWRYRSGSYGKGGIPGFSAFQK
jgi:hypothetical protein